MRSFFAAASLAATASAAALRRGESCSFQIISSGGVDGVMGQFEDGQNRINGSYAPATYHYSNGGIIDEAGRGCIVTLDNDATHQFQCDLNKPPTYGFTIAQNGSILYQGNDQFYACPYITEYNVYTQWLKDQDKCVLVKLSTNSTCAAGSYPSGTAGVYQPTGGSGSGIPGYSAPPYPSVLQSTPAVYSTGAVPQTTPQGTAPGGYGVPGVGHSQSTIPASSIETGATIPGYGGSSETQPAYSQETGPASSAPGASIPGYGGSVPVSSEATVPSYGVPSSAYVPGASTSAVSTPIESSPVESVPGYGGSESVPVASTSVVTSSVESIPGYGGSASVPVASTFPATTPIESLPVESYSTTVETSVSTGVENVPATYGTPAESKLQESYPAESTPAVSTPVASVPATYPAGSASESTPAEETVTVLTTVLTTYCPETETQVSSGTTVYNTYETKSLVTSVITSTSAPAPSVPATSESVPVESASSPAASVPAYPASTPVASVSTPIESSPVESTSVVSESVPFYPVSTPVESYPVESTSVVSESVPAPTESVPKESASTTCTDSTESVPQQTGPATSHMTSTIHITPVPSSSVESETTPAESTTCTESTESASVPVPTTSVPQQTTPVQSTPILSSPVSSETTPVESTTWTKSTGSASIPAPSMSVPQQTTPVETSPVESTSAPSVPVSTESTSCTEETIPATTAQTTFATSWSAPAGNSSIPGPTGTAPVTSTYTHSYSQPWGTGSSSVTKPAGTTSAPSATVPATSTSATACQTSLEGAYQTPHLITWVSKDNPETSYGSKYNATINEECSTIMNFDIPQDYEGKTCSVVFLFPKAEELETSAWSWNEEGGINFAELNSAASEKTTYNTAPQVEKSLGEIGTLEAGESYVVYSGACEAGKTQSIELSSCNGLGMEFFEDWNPSSLGLYITAC